MFVLVLLLFLLVCGSLIALSVQNLSDPIHLVFYVWHTPAVPSGLWIVGGFLLGALLLYLIAVASEREDRSEISALRRRVFQLEEEKRQSMSIGPARGPIPPSPMPVGLPTAPLSRASGPLQPVSPFIPMPGIATSLPQPSPEYRP